LDPFEALGIKPEFALDLASLERRHRELSGALHPDRYAGAGAGERRMALGRAIEVNEAFRILKDPVRRAEALLARRGVESGEGKEPPASPALLLDVLERREALVEIRHSRNKAALTALITEVRKLEASAESGLAGQLAFDHPGASDVLKLLGELRYYRRLLSEAEAIADEFF
jgi:molecular chaperone HscB